MHFFYKITRLRRQFYTNCRPSYDSNSQKDSWLHVSELTPHEKSRGAEYANLLHTTLSTHLNAVFQSITTCIARSRKANLWFYSNTLLKPESVISASVTLTENLLV